MELSRSTCVATLATVLNGCLIMTPIVPRGFGSLSLSIPWFVSAHKTTGGTGLSLKPLGPVYLTV